MFFHINLPVGDEFDFFFLQPLSLFLPAAQRIFLSQETFFLDNPMAGDLGILVSPESKTHQSNIPQTQELGHGPIGRHPAAGNLGHDNPDSFEQPFLVKTLGRFQDKSGVGYSLILLWIWQFCPGTSR